MNRSQHFQCVSHMSCMLYSEKYFAIPPTILRPTAAAGNMGVLTSSPLQNSTPYVSPVIYSYLPEEVLYILFYRACIAPHAARCNISDLVRCPTSSVAKHVLRNLSGVAFLTTLRHVVGGRGPRVVSHLFHILSFRSSGAPPYPVVDSLSFESH
ncbi:unnamed protein product [Scytosiphon promiscuus]